MEIHDGNRSELDEDTLLMLLVVDGDHMSFERLYNKYWLIVINNIRDRTRNKEDHKEDHKKDLEDIAQEVFLRIWQNRDKFKHKSKFITYLFGYIRNVLREKNNTRDVITLDCTMSLDFVSNLPLPDTEFQYKETAGYIRELLNKLPEQQRITFKAFYINEFSVEKVAKLLGCSTGSVYNNLHRARKKLCKLLKHIQE